MVAAATVTSRRTRYEWCKEVTTTDLVTLLAKQQPPMPQAMNIIGSTPLDRSVETVISLQKWWPLAVKRLLCHLGRGL